MEVLLWYVQSEQSCLQLSFDVVLLYGVRWEGETALERTQPSLPNDQVWKTGRIVPMPGLGLFVVVAFFLPVAVFVFVAVLVFAAVLCRIRFLLLLCLAFDNEGLVVKPLDFESADVFYSRNLNLNDIVVYVIENVCVRMVWK